MKKIILLTLSLMLLCTAAIAKTATSTPAAAATLMPEQAFALIGLMRNAFSGGDWATGAGLLLTLALALFRILGINKLIPKRHNKWMAGGIAMATSFAVGLTAHMSWWAVLSTGLGVGLTAVGGWEVLGEPLRTLWRWIRAKFFKKKAD